MACSTRPTNMTAKLGATMPATEPTRNRPMAMSMRWRVQKRRERKVTAGTVMPSTSIYMVVSHWPTPASMPKSASTAVSMELTAVWERLPMAVASTTTANIRYRGKLLFGAVSMTIILSSGYCARGTDRPVQAHVAKLYQIILIRTKPRDSAGSTGMRRGR